MKLKDFLTKYVGTAEPSLFMAENEKRCASTTPDTGLGLSIAREIVQRHGSRIEVRSEGIPGKGAAFFVWLPASA